MVLCSCVIVFEKSNAVLAPQITNNGYLLQGLVKQPCNILNQCSGSVVTLTLCHQYKTLSV